MLVSPLSVIPPAACHVLPEVSSERSMSITSDQPSLVRW